MTNQPLRDLVDTLGLKRVLADLARICGQEADEDLTFRSEWMRAATKINKLSQNINANM